MEPEVAGSNLVIHPIFTPIELLVGFFNAFLAYLSPTIVGDFLFWATQPQTDTFAYGAFGPQKQEQKVSLYPFALHLTARNLISSIKFYIQITEQIPFLLNILHSKPNMLIAHI